MPTRFRRLVSAGAAVASLVVLATSSPRGQQHPPPTQQPAELELTISGEPGTPPKFAVPDFVALGSDPESQAAAKAIGAVLWDDLRFEREFYMIPRDTYASIPAAKSFQEVPFDRWLELGADGVGDRVRAAVGDGRDGAGAGVQRSHAHVGLWVQRRGVEPAPLRAHGCRRGAPAAARVARRRADEAHLLVGSRWRACGRGRPQPQHQGDLRRRLRRREPAPRDGDARAQHLSRLVGRRPCPGAYASYRRNNSPDIFISSIYQGTPPETPLKGRAQNWLASWWPDGTRSRSRRTATATPSCT